MIVAIKGQSECKKGLCNDQLPTYLPTYIPTYSLDLNTWKEMSNTFALHFNIAISSPSPHIINLHKATGREAPSVELPTLIPAIPLLLYWA
jgi:hypothetical protein